MIPLLKHRIKYHFYACAGLLFFVFFNMNPAQAQDTTTSLFMLKGKILTSDSLLPVHNAHIISKFNRWGTISDDKGDFAMLVNKNDSLLITSMGFSPLVLFLNDSVEHTDPPYLIYMAKDTILINEFVIHAFWDYTTFKQMIIEMKPIDFDFSRLDCEENLLLSLPTTGAGIPGPVGLLYNYFNKEARMKRHLLKNRRQYNQLMIQMGRPQDTIPSKPEHMQGWPR